MIRYRVHLDNPHKRSIQKAIEALENGQLIIYPTDTVYGIGCSIRRKNAIENIYRLKGKSKFDPMSIVCSSIQQASTYVKISNYTYKILRRCLPGPFTFILEATREIPRLMLSKRKEIGIRIPDNKVAIETVDALGHAILNTSVNIAGNAIMNDPDVIADRFYNRVEIMLDGGILPDAEESTVIRLIHDTLEMIRPGKGDLQKINI